MSVSASDPRILLQHAGYVRALARAVVRDAELAREVEQETWVAALQHAPRDLRTPRAWLATIVRRAARRLWARAAERAAREPAVVAERAATADVEAADELLEREQALRGLVAAVRALPEPQRTAIVLHYLDQLPLREVARRTDAPLETVRSRVKRGLELLRGELERSRGRAWSRGLVRALALDPAELSPAGAELAREPLILLTAMSTTLKGLSAATLLAVVLVAGWLARGRMERGAPPEPAEPSLRVPLAEASAARAAPPPADPGAPARVAALPANAPTVRATTGSLLARISWAEDGTPAAGVPVRVDLLGALPARRRQGESGADGALELTELAPGTVVVQPLFGGLALAEIVAGETAEVAVEIPAGIRVSGRVQDVREAPVAGAEIFLDGGAAEPQYEGAIVAHSDARGRFEVRSVPAGVGASLSARARDRAPSQRAFLTGAPRTAVEVILVLDQEGRELAGRVTDTGGEPLAHARVLIGSEREIALERQPDGTLSAAPIGELCVSDADGRFAVAGAPLGIVSVQVRAAGFAPWRGECDVRTTGWLDVRLERGASVTGSVRSASGAPVGRAVVRAAGSHGFAGAEAFADLTGAYELRDLAAGALELEAAEPDHGRATTVLTLAPLAQAEWHPVLGGGAVLLGRIEAPGEELAGWTVYGFGEGDARAYHEETRTDADGRFALRACPAGDVGVTLHGRGGTPFPVARLTGLRAGGPEVVLRPDPELAPTTRIFGRLVDEHGAPVRNADVRATHARSGTTLVHPDAEDGAFELARLPCGEWTLEADAFVAGWGVERLARTLAPGETWDVGRLRLGPGGTVRVSLVDAAGVHAARVALVHDAEGRLAQELRVEAGEACSRPLAPGTYRLVVHGADGAPEANRELVVLAGQETSVEILVGHPARPEDAAPR